MSVIVTFFPNEFSCCVNCKEIVIIIANFFLSIGNEEYIANIVSKLLSFLVGKGYFDAATAKPLPEFDEQLRKIAFYLVLNTEATFKYNLMTDHSVCHLINTLPTLPKALLHAFIWGLHLEQYFCDIIAYTPIWFAYQFIDNVGESLKYVDPYETLKHVDQLVCAIYKNIARSDFRQMDAVDKQIILNKYLNVTMDLMRHYYSPDIEKFTEWSKDKNRKYLGYMLKHNLNMVIYCFELFLKRPSFKSDPIEYNMFALMSEREPLINNHRDSYSDIVQNELHKINMTLLNTLQFSVLQVDIDTFMYWVEVDIDEENTLQRVNGEAFYKVHQMINSNVCFKHGVSVPMEALVIKPLTVSEKIANIKKNRDWIQKLEKLADTNNEHIELWLNGFIDKGELVLNNEECLETLGLHTKSLTVPIIKRLIQFASKVDTDKDGRVEEKLIEICLDSIDNFSIAQIYELIQYAIDEQQSGFGNFQLDNFDQFLIEVFNKTKFTQNRNNYLKLLFQNPQLFYAKVFDEALTTDMQMQHMIEIVNETSTIFKNFATNQLNYLIERENLSGDANDLLPQLLAGLFFTDILKPSEFIVDIFYKRHLINAMKNANYNQLELLITTLNIIANKFKFDGMCPPLLVMAAQLLELCRWKLNTFTEQLVSIVTKTINFINSILKVFLPTATQNEKNWIVPKLASYGPLTRYYFQKLTLPQPKKLDDFLWPPNKIQINKEDSVNFLCEYFVQCTAKEIDQLANNDKLLLRFWDVFYLIKTIVQRSNQANEINCLKYCCIALLSVVQVQMNLYFSR